MNTERLVSRLAIVLILAEVLLVLLSWLLSAMGTDGVRPLLSAEGVRWFFAHFTGFISSPLLAWLLLASMAAGCLAGSGLLRPCAWDRQHSRPLLLALLLLVAYAAVLALLTLTPHAPLLSATGTLWPSPFSRALIPVMAFAVILGAAGYGLAAHKFTSFADICHSMVGGIAALAPLFFLFVLFMQLAHSLRFAFF